MSVSKTQAERGEGLSDQSLTVSSPAVALTVPFGTASAMVTNGAGAVRVRWGTPTASVGHYLNPYSIIELYGDDVDDVKFIRVATDSTIHITYFGG